LDSFFRVCLPPFGRRSRLLLLKCGDSPSLFFPSVFFPFNQFVFPRFVGDEFFAGGMAPSPLFGPALCRTVPSTVSFCVGDHSFFFMQVGIVALGSVDLPHRRSGSAPGAGSFFCVPDSPLPLFRLVEPVPLLPLRNPFLKFRGLVHSRVRFSVVQVCFSQGLSFPSLCDVASWFLVFFFFHDVLGCPSPVNVSVCPFDSFRFFGLIPGR